MSVGLSLAAAQVFLSVSCLVAAQTSADASTILGFPVHASAARPHRAVRAWIRPQLSSSLPPRRSNLDRSKSVPAAEGSGRLSTSMQREQSLPAPRSAEGDLCAACRLPLIGEHVIVQGKGYHGACFVCAGCGQPVERGVPFVRAEDGYGKEGPWCVCFASPCSAMPRARQRFGSWVVCCACILP